MSKPVNITTQLLISIIPFGWLYSFYMVDKLNKGWILLGLAGLTGLASGIFFYFPDNLVVDAVIIYPFMLFFVNKWSKEWNQSFIDHQKNPQKSTPV